MSKLEFILHSAYRAARRPGIDREATEVLGEYTASWVSFRDTLAAASTLDQWLTIDGFDSRLDWYNVDGRLAFERYNSSAFYRETLRRLLDQNFPQFQSITEYGCGIGRNLLFLKRLYPHVRCYGYELVPEGVDIARKAAAKFAIEVEYTQLDYVRDQGEKFVFPATDVAFTMFSLEQLPAGCDVAMNNILRRVNRGSIHLEPVVENYPYGPRGLIGRLDHRKAGYLRGFSRGLRQQALSDVRWERMKSSHNPLMFPSTYVLKK